MAEAYVTDFESNMYFKIVLEDLLESLNKVLEFEYSNIICCFIYSSVFTTDIPLKLYLASYNFYATS